MHVLQAKQPIRQIGEPSDLAGQTNNISRRPEIDDRQILANLLPDALIRRAALRVVDGARSIQQFVDRRFE